MGVHRKEVTLTEAVGLELIYYFNKGKGFGLQKMINHGEVTRKYMGM